MINQVYYSKPETWKILHFVNILAKGRVMPGILFKNRHNIEFALKFNKICQNMELCV